MKINLRQCCFETNSSSQHSIIITKNDTHIDRDNILWDRNKDDNYNTVYLDRHGKLDLYEIKDGYGRYPFQILISFEDKFKYAMCEFLGYLYTDDPEYDKYYQEFKNIATDVIPGFKDFDLHLRYIDVYLDEDGNEIMHKDLHYDYWDSEKDRAEYYYLDENKNKHAAIYDEDRELEIPSIGNIDHQSAGLLKRFLENRNITLKEFLTNNKYTICIDGDEYNELDKLIKSGFIDMNFISEIYF